MPYSILLTRNSRLPKATPLFWESSGNTSIQCLSSKQKSICGASQEILVKPIGKRHTIAYHHLPQFMRREPMCMHFQLVIMLRASFHTIPSKLTRAVSRFFFPHSTRRSFAARVARGCVAPANRPKSPPVRQLHTSITTLQCLP